MNRTILALAGALSASSLLLADAAVKGTALLLLATAAVMVLRRDSAATRHLVWQLAIVALLVVPALSALLPQWRVLPGWVGVSTQPLVAESDPPSIARPSHSDDETPQEIEPAEIERPVAAASRPVAESPDLRPASTVAATVPASALGSTTWFDALSVVWALGCGLLLLRLVAARWLLWNSERRGTVIGSSEQPATANPDALVAALAAACAQLGIRYPVRLLVHPDRTIPVVWGIVRWRLLLPEAARHWSGEQLRSVLLHELAHIQRRDTIAQLLAQIACALYWFNPLVWFAAGRLGVERERACDDLVLASGVRPSAYAGHLLDVVTALSPAPWTQTCGLAMARKSSLEGRLVAVLSAKSNRRRVSAFLAGLALAICAGIAVPLAMLRATDERPTLTAAPVPAATPATPEKNDMKPKHEYAQSLFAKWKANARTDGKIPGALIGQLAEEVDSFVKQYPRDDKTSKLAALRPRLDATHDWTQANIVSLLDDITAISTAPVSWTDIPIEFDAMRLLKRGQPLPAALQNVEWGAPAANGLRVAWLLDPRAEQYPFGSVLKSRVLYHNSGKLPIVFSADAWHQYDEHKARDANRKDIRISSTRYTGITPSATFRLTPGEYCEVLGHGIAIGAGKYEEEHSVGSVGAVIEAKVGDDVHLSHDVQSLDVGWTRPGDPKDPAELWKKGVAERVAREGPMPQAVADREQLIRRATLDIFGIPPSAEEVAAFVADKAPDALAKLTLRLQAKPRPEPFTGTLATGDTRFRVVAADPNAATKPATANRPGRYVLGDNVRLLVSQTATSSQRTNEAIIAFLSPDPKVASPHKPYEIALPNDLRTWGAVWQRGSGEVWVMQKGLVRKYDFRDPDHVKETRFEPGTIADVPEALRKELGKAFDAGAAPAKEQQEAPKSSKGARASDPLEPKNKKAQPLFRLWQSYARKNGNIPGGLIGLLGDKVKEFIRNNTGQVGGDAFAKKMMPLVPRFDATRDWTPAEALALLDDVAAVNTIPPEMTLWEIGNRTFRKGMPLPPALGNAPWGDLSPSGLRLAWLLEPRAAEYRLNTPLSSHILVQNMGKETIVFRARDWHQSSQHKAHDAKGADVGIDSTEWTRLSRLEPFRLAPGEFVELGAAGIGVGAHKKDEDTHGVRVGSWIKAKAGDEVTFLADAVPLSEWNEARPAADDTGWWLPFIAERLNRDAPAPKDAVERTRLLDRAVRDLFGTPPTKQENADFVADRGPNPLDWLAKRLAHRDGFVPFTGSLASGPTTFRVLPVDPDAAKKPRTASGPGRYTLDDLIRLAVTRRPVGERLVNEASIEFFSKDPTKPAPGKAHTVKLPDGYASWAAAWMRGGTVLWVGQKGEIRSYDFTNPAQVKETAIQDPAHNVPIPILEALRPAFELPAAPKQTPKN